MPLQLLPKSAAAFAPRAPPNIVLGPKVEAWLTQTLKRINKIKRPLHNPTQHYRCLTETLGGEAAIWTLASLLLPKAPDADLRKDENPLMEAINNYDMMHIEAYVVHVDMVSQHEVAFKLNKQSIDALIEYHRDIWCIDSAARTPSWPEKDSQIKKLHEDFVQATNRFVFRTDVRALEGLEEDGAGELLSGKSEDVKKSILNLFNPLDIPPPPVENIVYPAPMMPSTSSSSSGYLGGWWNQNSMLSLHPPQMDSWRVLPSTPSPTTTSCSDMRSQSWPPTSMSFEMPQLPSPTPSYSQPVYTSASLFNSPPAFAAMPSMLYPSQLPQSCGTSMNGNQFDIYGYSYSNFAAPQYATTM